MRKVISHLGQVTKLAFWCLTVTICLSCRPTQAQQIQGAVNVLVADPMGGVIPNAQLKLVETSTNDTRTSVTLGDGTYRFIGLKIGNYTLTVSRQGFNSKLFKVEVQAAQTTDVTATLEVGSTEQVVVVKGDITPVIDRTSNAINTILTPEQIQDLPLGGRDISSMSHLVPGYDGSTWNGLPTMAQSSSI